MIYGDRVRLRYAERADLESFVEWLNDPEIRSGIARFNPISLAQEERWFEQSLGRDEREQTLAVELNDKGVWRLVGSCGLGRFDDRARHAELGILIGDKSRWGQGLGTDVMRTLLRHAFETLNLHRVHLRVYADNQRALRLYRKVGFVEEGRLREDSYAESHYRDTVVMGMLRSEWEQASEGTD